MDTTDLESAKNGGFFLVLDATRPDKERKNSENKAHHPPVPSLLHEFPYSLVANGLDLGQRRASKAVHCRFCPILRRLPLENGRRTFNQTTARSVGTTHLDNGPTGAQSPPLIFSHPQLFGDRASRGPSGSVLRFNYF